MQESADFGFLAMAADNQLFGFGMRPFGVFDEPGLQPCCRHLLDFGFAAGVCALNAECLRVGAERLALAGGAGRVELSAG